MPMSFTPAQRAAVEYSRGNLLLSAAAGSGASNRSGEDSATRLLLKYATIIVSVILIICVYPFVQKYFTKGVMIGAIKG